MQVIVDTCRKTLRNSGATQASLSRRDLQLARLVTEGRLNKEISFCLGITEGTVKVYMSNLYAKLGVGNRAELAAWTVRNENLLQRDAVCAESAQETTTGDPHFWPAPLSPSRKPESNLIA